MLPRRKRQALQKVEVEAIAALAEISLMPVGAVVIDLYSDVVAGAYDSLPSAQNIAARQERIGVRVHQVGRRICDHLDPLTGGLVVEVALQGEGIPVVPAPIY